MGGEELKGLPTSLLACDGKVSPTSCLASCNASCICSKPRREEAGTAGGPGPPLLTGVRKNRAPGLAVPVGRAHRGSSQPCSEVPGQEPEQHVYFCNKRELLLSASSLEPLLSGGALQCRPVPILGAPTAPRATTLCAVPDMPAPHQT